VPKQKTEAAEFSELFFTLMRGSMGRRPDHPAVQEAKGNPGKRRRKTVQDVIEAAELPDGTPRHLSEAARLFWGRIAGEVQRLNFVRLTDRSILERYCETLAEYWQIQTQLRGKPRFYWTDTKHGKMKRIEPTVLLQHRVEKMLLDYEDRIGLNPLARQRILIGMAASQGALPLDPLNEGEKDGNESGQGGGTTPQPEDSPVGFLTTRH
jgi:P27 family predicted phage terminase small subunit